MPQTIRSSEMFGNGRTRNFINRVYFAEPILIAQRILAYHGLGTDICACMDYPNAGYAIVPFKGSETDFKFASSMRLTAWTLTRDSSVIGLLKGQLVALSQAITDRNPAEWDSHGIELVSPVFDLTSDGKQKACTQLGARIEALRSGRTYDMLETTWAGLHVHVGLDVDRYRDQENQKLGGILQHLSYMLIAQEPLITTMFPKSRSGRPEVLRDTDAVVLDNDDLDEIEMLDADEELDRTFRWTEAPRSDLEVAEFEEDYTGWADLRSNRAWVDQQLTSRDQEPCDGSHQSYVFQGPDHRPQIQASNAEFGNEPDRGYIYKFSNIHNYLNFNPDRSTSEKPTVEFRQHECCLDVEKIRHWLDFLEAIFRKAEALSEQEGTGHTHLERQSSKYGPEFPFRSPSYLCHWLDLDGAECEYWEERQASYQAHHRSFHDEHWRKVAPSTC